MHSLDPWREKNSFFILKIKVQHVDLMIAQIMFRVHIKHFNETVCP